MHEFHKCLQVCYKTYMGLAPGCAGLVVLAQNPCSLPSLFSDHQKYLSVPLHPEALHLPAARTPAPAPPSMTPPK